MNAKDALKSNINLCSMVVKTYLADLEHADFMRRPSEGCNHVAFQLGHCIASELQMLEMVAPGKAGLSLPEGFAETHAKDNNGNDDPAAFLSKDAYLKLFDEVRAASLTVLEGLSDEDLDQPSPENFQSFAPTLGDFFNLIATHPMMHAGQFVVVRRLAGKPIVM